jgi:NAD(P)-dependent dehydrogenase (short-subunit alcohol dehydrogenase family)
LKGVVNTCTLAIYHLRQQAEGGSIVISGSTTGLQRVRAVDYCKFQYSTRIGTRY